MMTMRGCIFVENNNNKNMSDKNQTNLIDSSLPTLLFIVFLILKLTGNIDWSWWWVTSPLWIPIAAVLVFIVLIMILNKCDI